MIRKELERQTPIQVWDKKSFIFVYVQIRIITF